MSEKVVAPYGKLSKLDTTLFHIELKSAGGNFLKSLMFISRMYNVCFFSAHVVSVVSIEFRKELFNYTKIKN